MRLAAWSARCSSRPSSHVSLIGDNLGHANEPKVTPTEESITLGDSVGGAPGSAGLASEVYLCMTSDSGQVIYNGLLSAEPAGILVSGPYNLPSPSQIQMSGHRGSSGGLRMVQSDPVGDRDVGAREGGADRVEVLDETA